jgi:hypothetical protein
MYHETPGPDQTGRFAFKKIPIGLELNGYECVRKSNDVSLNDVFQEKLVLVFALDGFLVGVFHAM